MLDVNAIAKKGARLAAILFLIGFVKADVCQTFAGGAVYPRETRTSSGHSLQWTKAMSN